MRRPTQDATTRHTGGGGWRRSLIGAAIAVACLAGAGAASAGIVQVNHNGEPPYTKGTSNTWWFRFTSSYGAGDDYRIHVRTYAGPTQINFQTVDLPAGPQNYNGATFNDVYTGLTSGVTYRDCGNGETYWGYLSSWVPDANGSCSAFGFDGTSTTMDNTKPNAQVFVNGTDTYAKSLNVAYRIDYQDAVAPPFPANFVCRSFGSPGTCPIFNYEPNCSVATMGNSTTNQFLCNETLPANAPDGPVYFCARVADRAVPETGVPDQFTGSTGDKANLSDTACGNVILDRTAPGVSATANGTPGAITVKVGDLVTFAAQANDATSGVPNPFNWTFGDNTPGAAGASVPHTYTQAGTFVAKVTTTDGAGNPAEATVTVTVTPPPTGGTGGSTGSGTVTPPPTPQQISRQTGGGGTQTTTVAGLSAIAPRTVRITPRLANLPIALTAGGPGKVAIQLRRGTKIVAKAGTTFTRAGRAGFRLRLPRRLSPGIHKLRITFTPTGRPAVTKIITVRFTGRARLKEITVAPMSAPVGRGPQLSPER